MRRSGAVYGKSTTHTEGTGSRRYTPLGDVVTSSTKPAVRVTKVAATTLAAAERRGITVTVGKCEACWGVVEGFTSSNGWVPLVHKTYRPGKMRGAYACPNSRPLPRR
jgi:hypothetical protein